MNTARGLDEAISRVQSTYRRWGRTTSAQQMRADWDALFSQLPVDARVRPFDADGLQGQWVEAPGANPAHVAIYVHGGGFQIGSTRSHLELMAGISAATGCSVMGVDYRLGPENTFPAPVDDIRTAYLGHLAKGARGTNTVLIGDSAGGNIVLSVLLQLRDSGVDMPAAAVLMSPWTDMSTSGESYATRSAADPINQKVMLASMARRYFGPSRDLCDPEVSPLFAQLHGLPPLLIQVGDREVVLSDAVSLAEKVEAAGGVAQLEVWDGMVHVFQQFPELLPEAQLARDAIGRFIRGLLAKPIQGAV